MTCGNRWIWIFALSAFLVATSGCARTFQRSVEDELARSGTRINQERGQSIRGYHLYDGTSEEYNGWVRIAEQDSLVFWSEGYSEDFSHHGVKKMIEIPGPVYALSAIQALDVRESRSGRSALLIASGFLVGMIVVELGTMSSI